jgi:hypothetical protein
MTKKQLDLELVLCGNRLKKKTNFSLVTAVSQALPPSLVGVQKTVLSSQTSFEKAIYDGALQQKRQEAQGDERKAASD